MSVVSADVCSTCGELYKKNEISGCSNGFHCCRDCVWDNGVITDMCEDCEFTESERAHHDSQMLYPEDYGQEDEQDQT